MARHALLPHTYVLFNQGRCMCDICLCMSKAREHVGVCVGGEYSKKLLILITAYIHWILYIVCREKGKPWQIEFSSSFPHGQWIFT